MGEASTREAKGQWLEGGAPWDSAMLHLTHSPPHSVTLKHALLTHVTPLSVRLKLACSHQLPSDTPGARLLGGGAPCQPRLRPRHCACRRRRLLPHLCDAKACFPSPTSSPLTLQVRAFLEAAGVPPSEAQAAASYLAADGSPFSMTPKLCSPDSLSPWRYRCAPF
jgi:hypothetical protein